jgi:hypothetical protein
VYIKDKSVKTRKEHDCWGCMKIFPKGTIMNRQTNSNDGIIESIYWCESCEKLLSTLEPFEEIGYGDFNC